MTELLRWAVYLSEDGDLTVWLARTALGGGGVLLLAWWVQRWLGNAATQQRLGEWAVVAALLVALTAALPAWWHISVTLPTTEPIQSAAVLTEPLPQPPVIVRWLPELEAPLEPIHEKDDPVVVEAASEPILTKAPSWSAKDWFFLGYAVLAGVMLLHWLLANLAVWWLLRKRRSISPGLAALFAEMSWPRRTRLIVSDRVQVPFSVGFWRPTVVLPAKLVDEATTEELRWVLAHELTHVARHDTRTCWLFILGQVFFFYLPWFWWLRRQVRLSQEYLADAAALKWAGSPADYAQFLLSWACPRNAANNSAVQLPAVVTPVTGSGSDLFRRVTMMLDSKKTYTIGVSRSWVAGLAVGLVALGLLVGGVGFKAIAAEDPKQETPKVEKQNPFPGELNKLFENMPGFDDDLAKELRERMEELRKQMEEMRKQMGKGGFNFQGQFPGGQFVFPNIENELPFGLAGTSPRQQRLGAQVREPSKTLIEQLDLPQNQGIVLEEVGANSAAAKAGLKPHDIVLELDGKPVPSDAKQFIKMISEVKANTPVDVVVLRKGKKETVKGLTLPEVKPVAAANNFGFRGNFQPMMPFNAAARAFAGGGAGTMTSMVRNNDEFTTKHKEGDLSITIKGTINQGVAKVSEVTIDEGNGQKATYDSLDKVPATHKAKVEKLTEMSAKGIMTFPIR